MSDLDSSLDFYKSTKPSRAGGLRRLTKQMAFLHYLGLTFKDIHKYAATQGYKGTYSSFTSWLRRNVDFDAEIRKYESEFRARDPRPSLGDPENSTKSFDESTTVEGEMFAPRTKRKTEQDRVETKGQSSPRDALNKWKKPSYEDQLDKHGIGKHDDKDSSC
ncbi:hypothetical protein Nstercoris_02270 (plasmid) [Nitrosomonas stercoris]|uniref:Uncharacterized protein n=1 Tax=Nitrosomonas stercoris TaxID=1444684 RepID=A0A4Y1YRW1_9PROT|nr:hypothetical protein Nstercoris_02270 [Nitrosomonas stercoris]